MSEESKAKQDTLDAFFYDEEYGYGSRINTLKYVRQIHKYITMDDIIEFMNKVACRSKKGKCNYKSFVVNFSKG